MSRRDVVIVAGRVFFHRGIFPRRQLGDCISTGGHSVCLKPDCLGPRWKHSPQMPENQRSLRSFHDAKGAPVYHRRATIANTKADTVLHKIDRRRAATPNAQAPLQLVGSRPSTQDPHLVKRDEQTTGDLDPPPTGEVTAIAHTEADTLSKHIKALVQMPTL